MPNLIQMAAVIATLVVHALKVVLQIQMFMKSSAHAITLYQLMQSSQTVLVVLLPLQMLLQLR
jgi:hypothetical protein